jgi:ubiquinone/menaquinone biosynthesis C-methylase UbiE
MTKDYVFDHSEADRQRLMRLSDFFGEPTERLFRTAGIAPGHNILDVGTGAGDVAMLAASLVGSTGSVIGIERDIGQAAFANARLKTDGFANASVVQGDLNTFITAHPVDAVIGRFVLIYMSDVVSTLKALSRSLKPGGVMAFFEVHHQFDGPPTIEPQTTLAATAAHWFREGQRHAGVQQRMGFRLPIAMRQAGLEPMAPIQPFATMRSWPDGDLFPVMTRLIKTSLKSIVASGVATEAEIDVDTLEARLTADAPKTGVVGAPILNYAGVWARKPG